MQHFIFRMFHYACIFLCLLVVLPSTSFAQMKHSHHDQHHPLNNAPIGIMGDHIHEQGDWMFSYRYKFMGMEGNRNSTSNVSEANVLTSFMVAPRKMDMHMHMFGAMFAPRDFWTTTLMIPYLEIEMDHINRSAATFTRKSTGIGDLKWTQLIRVYHDKFRQVHLNLGMSFPTGSIERADSGTRLPYPMQLGSGTFDLLPGVTYTERHGPWAWGAQVGFTFRLGKNEEEYRRGHLYEFNSWFARYIAINFSGSIRMQTQITENYSGADPNLTPTMVQTADPSRQGGEKINLLFGINYVIPEKCTLAGNRLAIEAGLPVYQSLNGPQLETDWMITVGWQYAF